jgi:hypothetical protein
MIDPSQVPNVSADEVLARFVLQSSHIRSSNGTVKADAFIPHPHRDLSVTRHLQATADELWAVGEAVATATGKALHGRADIKADVCADNNLTVHAAPVEDNPNHANISSWPDGKPLQKIIAQIIAATAKLVLRRGKADE